MTRADASSPAACSSNAMGKGLYRLGICVCLALVGWTSGSIAYAQTTVAGVTSGALSVDETGSAGYTVPIAVPPGIAGMQPSLALVYNSHGSNGTAGVGWSLSASSSIHRCSQTLAQDGAIHGVDFSTEDRFCLDGQRLVAVSGAYGADGTEYRTEIDGFARIISHGVAGSGPERFTVESKSGQILDYGNTIDSRLGVPGASEIRLWSLNRVTDSLGNAITYHYIEDPADKSYRLDKVAYAYDAAVTTAKSEVRLVYEARPDTRTSYLAGAELAMTQRLTNIETWTESGPGLALVKDVRLTYEVSPATSRSRITSITECDASDNCLEPVQLDWQGQAPGYLAEDVSTSWGMTAGLWSNTRKAHILDYNGDGRSDILLQGLTSSNATVLMTATDTAYTWQVIDTEWGMSTGLWAADRRSLFVLDHNGDGLSDVLLQGVDSSRDTYLLTSNGTGFDNAAYVTDSWAMSIGSWAADGRNLFVLDHNGDGLSDILLQGRGTGKTSFLLTSNGAGFESAENVTNAWGMTGTHWAADHRQVHILDHNGDGLSDILLQGRGTGRTSFLLTSNGAGFESAENVTNAWGMTGTHWAADHRQVHILDHNGDGLSDILLQGRGTGRTSFLLASNGAGFESAENVTNAWGMTGTHWAADHRQVHILDQNGDNLSDILLQGVSDIRNSYLLTSSSDAFVLTEITNAWGLSTTHWAVDHRSLLVLDRNGDGLTDTLLHGGNKNRTTFLLTHNGPTPDLPTSVTDSLGRVSTIDYTPLTDDTVYTKDADAVFPVVDIRAPLYVVKSVSSDDGLGGQAVTNYSYAGGKVHVQGRGFRGFRQMTATDEQTGIATTTDYHQVFPYTAQVSQSVKTLADGTIIKTIDNTWDQLSLNGGDTVYPYVAASVSEDYEINDGLGNSPIVSRTASAVFDTFGNATSLTTTTTGGGESFTKTTVNTYDNDTTNWFLGLLRRSEVTRSRGTP